MKKFFCILISAIIITGLVISHASFLEAKPIKFKAVAFLPLNNTSTQYFKVMIDMINKEFKDHINIDLLGGPEVTPPFQLHEAVKNGVIDMCQTSATYYPSLLWEAQSASLCNLTYEEKYKTDYYDTFEKLHADVGLIWLDNINFGVSFYIFTNKPVKKPGDLAGQQIRIIPSFIPFMKALGAASVNLPMGDIYTAMERGNIDGFVQAYMGFVTDFSFHEVTKYVINHPLYQGPAWILANPKKWNKIPKEVQKKIIEFKKNKVNPVVLEIARKDLDKEWKLLLKSGVKPIKFSSTDEKAYLKLSLDSAWDHIIAKSPTLGPKLKKMLVK